MATKYFALLTNIGAAKLANATALGAKVEITQMAVGDGNGALPAPNPSQTALTHELRRAQLNMLTIDPVNTNQIIAEQVIPEDVGGWWIREIGLFDKDGDMIAVANCAETYKPQLQEGSGRVQVIRVILIVSSTDAVTLKIDPSVVLATRKYVDDAVIEIKAYTDGVISDHVKDVDPHSQYAPKASPTFTGTPKAPTPAASDNTTQLATTAFVQVALAALINGAPSTLDTLKEIAAAINNDPNFSNTINDALKGKQPLDNTLTALSGKTVVDLLEHLGLKEAAKRDVGTGTNQIPDMSSFNTGNTNSFRLPTGHFVQIGSGQTISGGFTQSYPTPFPSICQALVGVVYSTLGVRAFIATNTSDRTAANMNVVDSNGNGINVTVGYIAIGR